jgi:uncharacterized membrane protein YeiH
VSGHALGLLGTIDISVDVAQALPAWSQLTAVAVGAVSGAAYAARRGFDVVGVLLLAVAEGLGGLLLRDTLLQTGSSIVLVDARYLSLAAGAAVLGFFFAGLIDRLDGLVVVLDALALGILCSAGSNAAMREALDWLPAIFIGTVTAVGGITLRDLLAGDAPRVLRPGVFTASAAFFGALAFVTLVKVVHMDRTEAQIVVILLVFALRLLAIKWSWSTRPAQDITERIWRSWSRKEVP